MQAAHEALQVSRGAVVNVASVHAIATSVGAAPYAASKAAIVALTRAAALEWAPEVRVNAVLPGAIDTPMLRQGVQRWAISSDAVEPAIVELGARIPLGRIGRPDEVAQAILFLADSDRSSFITGQTLVADGGALTRLSTE
jgi:NAD(P)-dependent dehydrogenase (short-subunit alcohol dehydrogenase family)